MTRPEDTPAARGELLPYQLGRAVVPSPEATDASLPAWQAAAHTPTFRFDQLHLGRYFEQGSQAPRYRDEAEVTVPEGGFRVRVAQGSHGPVLLSARAEDGYDIEVARLDEQQGLAWLAPDAPDGEVLLAADSGNLPAVPPLEWNSTNLGNPGTYWGVLRVTEQTTRATRHYAVGANFSGEPDDWRVRGTVLAVEPADSALPGGDQHPALPPS